MKGKELYTTKIAKAKADIQKWELSIYQLDNPTPLKPAIEPTKVISFRVPKDKADKLRKYFIKHILKNQKN